MTPQEVVLAWEQGKTLEQSPKGADTWSLWKGEPNGIRFDFKKFDYRVKESPAD